MCVSRFVSSSRLGSKRNSELFNRPFPELNLAMKELSVTRIFICLAVTYSFIPMDTLRLYAPFLVSNNLINLNNWFLKLSQLLERNLSQDPENFMTTPEIIVHRGYPAETHHVITDDGYILELHRIPHGQKEAQNKTFDSHDERRAVFLQHGMMGTDHFWVIGSTNNSLPFILADLGYDVWMGNSRGNTFSRKHVSLNPDEDKDFWEFSWDEMGRYDIPASIDYVLNVTGQRTLGAYIGYSLGCSIFFIGAIEEPRLNNKVEMMIGIGPTVSSAHLKNYFRLMAPFEKLYQIYQNLFGIGEIHAKNGLLHTIVRLVCKSSDFGAQIGRMWLSHVFGHTDELNKVAFHRLISHYPAGGSANTMAHLFQNFISGESFNYYDYGPVNNLKRYGSNYSPEYNLTMVTTPVVLVHADNDPFAPPEDVAWLKVKLGNLKDDVRVQSSTFCHGDFIWSHRMAELVYWPLIRLLPYPYL